MLACQRHLFARLRTGHIALWADYNGPRFRELDSAARHKPGRPIAPLSINFVEGRLILKTHIDTEAPLRVRVEMLLRDQMHLARFRLTERQTIRKYLIAESLPQSETLDGATQTRLNLLTHDNRRSSVNLVKEALP